MKLPGDPEPSLVEELAGTEGRKGLAQTAGPSSGCWSISWSDNQRLESNPQSGDTARAGRSTRLSTPPWFLSLDKYLIMSLALSNK